MKVQDLMRAQELEKRSMQSQRLENSSSEREKITNKQIVNKELTQLWNSNSGDQWDLFLKKYWKRLEPDTVPLEQGQDKGTGTLSYIILIPDFEN